MKKLITIISVLFLMISCTDNNSNIGSSDNLNNNGTETSTEVKKLSITVIDDKRCYNCWTEAMLNQLKQLPDIQNADIEIIDFSETWAIDIVTNNSIQTLPALLFSHNKIDKSLSDFLVETDSWKYSLNIGSTYNPFLERSDKWFLIIDMEEVVKIKKDSYRWW